MTDERSLNVGDIMSKITATTEKRMEQFKLKIDFNFGLREWWVVIEHSTKGKQIYTFNSYEEVMRFITPDRLELHFS